MSVFDLSKFSSFETIAHYIIELRNVGHVLPYDDYTIVKHWLEAIDHDEENLLLILSDVLPEYYDARRGGGPLPSLKGVHNRVLKNIHEFSGRQY